MITTLFDLEGSPIEKPKNRCRKCVHRYKHDYGKMYYCSKKADKKTVYGHKKIKSNANACSMFEALK